LTVEIPSPCPNEENEARMGQAVARARAEGVSQMAFGDLFLQDVRAYRDRMLAATGISPWFPLWGRPTDELARQMVAAGLCAVLTTVDPRAVPRSFAGRTFDHALLADLPDGVDACAERGEFHTFCTAGPMFARPIDVTVGEIVERDGFVFADVLPGAQGDFPPAP
jgi:diphthamide synthase (EF-2-diphthine--ammonia ligase)